MKCHICNKTLSDSEVQWNNDHQDWDPCGECQEVIDNVFEPLNEEEIDRQLEFEQYDEEGPENTLSDFSLDNLEET